MQTYHRAIDAGVPMGFCFSQITTLIQYKLQTIESIRVASTSPLWLAATEKNGGTFVTPPCLPQLSPLFVQRPGHDQRQIDPVLKDVTSNTVRKQSALSGAAEPFEQLD